MAFGYVDDFDATTDAPEGQIAVTFKPEGGASERFVFDAREAFDLAAKIQYAATQAMITASQDTRAH